VYAIVIALRISALIHLDGQTFFLDHSVAMTIDCRVDSDAEYVLVVLCKCPRTHNRPPLTFLARIDIHHGYNACCPCLDRDCRSLVKFEGEDVIVIGKRDAELEDKLSPAGND